MASKSTRSALVALALIASACTTPAEPPEITRALLPPVPPQVTTTTTAPIDPAAADRAAQTELREVLEMAETMFAEEGTYAIPPLDLGARIPAVNVISLQEAALADGVVYDARDDRATLYTRSQSGTWFCVDHSADGDDFGFGTDFESALTACTDGIRGADWGNPFSPTGQDESAIEAALRSLADALAEGDPESAALLFHADGCSDLADRWPHSLALSDTNELAIASLTLSGDRALVDARVGTLDEKAWELEKAEASWLVRADPCLLLEPMLTNRMELAATGLLQEGLHAVRSAFVTQEDFGFSAGAVANLDASLLFVPRDEVGFGTLYYFGSQAEGVLVTGGPAGSFYCAVESLSAVTVYGTGESADDVRTPGRCRRQSN